MFEKSLTRREFLKGTVGGAAALGGLSILNRNMAWAQTPYDFGDITITWAKVFFYDIPSVVARDKGFLKKEGIRIGDIFTSKGGSTTVRNIIDGGLLIGESAIAAAALAIVKQKEPYTLVAGGVKSPGSISWVVLEDADLHKIQDLKGKKMSYTRPGSVTQSLSALCLEKAPDISPDDVERIAAGGIGAGLTLLKNKEVDAAACLEPITALTKGIRVLFFGRSWLPEYFQTVWMAKNSFLKEHPDVMKGFLRARAKGVKFILENPKEAASILAGYNVKDLTKEGALTAMKNAGIPAGEYYTLGGFTKEGLELAEKGMRLAGVIGPNEVIPWKKIIDQSFLPEDQRIEL